MKKHVDTMIIIGTICSGFFWTSSKFNSVENRIAKIETQLMKIETVLILQKIMPVELAAELIEKEKK